LRLLKSNIKIELPAKISKKRFKWFKIYICNCRNIISFKNISIKEFRDKIESIFIKHQLTKVDFNIEKLSKKIKMERTAMYRKLYNLKIKKPKKIKK